MLAIIPAGGKGKRLHPLTLSTPKALLRVADKPLIEYPLLWLKENGEDDILVALNKEDNSLISYLKKRGIKYLPETKVREHFLNTDNGDSFLIIFSDIITTFDLKGLINHHKNSGASVTQGRVRNIPAGIFAVRWDYFFSPSFSLFNNLSYYDDNCLLYDIDTPSDYRRISKDILFKKELSFYFKDPDYIKTKKVIMDTSSHLEIGATINPPVFIGKNVYIEAGAEIGAFSVIGEGCKISKNSRTENSVIMADSLVSCDSLLKNTVVSPHTVIKKGAKILDNTVIGEGCVIGEGSIINPNVNIWPNKSTEDFKVITESITDVSTTNENSLKGEISVHFINMGESFLIYDEDGTPLTHSETEKLKKLLSMSGDNFLFLKKLLAFLRENKILLKDFKLGL